MKSAVNLFIQFDNYSIDRIYFITAITFTRFSDVNTIHKNLCKRF